MDEIIKNEISILDLREIKFEDLLLRDYAPPQELLMQKNILEKVVFVSGAGGSIGTEICRQAIQRHPKKIILLDHSEFNLYAVSEELKRIKKSLNSFSEIVPILGSIEDLSFLKRFLTFTLLIPSFTPLPTNMYHLERQTSHK